MNQLILKKLSQIPRDIDLIVGVPRSGMLPANLFALYLNLPYTDLNSFVRGYVYKAGERLEEIDVKRHKKVLIVDDSIGSGKALKKCKQILAPIAAHYTLEFCVIYATPERKNSIDYFFEVIPTPRIFQWNLFNHPILHHTCFDIDGVLCPDPTPEQNDDGPKYIEFLETAPVLYLPKCKIGAVVTSRLEKYRPQTVAWLTKHGIEYDQLLMIDLPDMRSRQLANNHASHKATVFNNSKYDLFIESNLKQAIQINSKTNKPVFCTENFEMIYDSQSFVYNIKSGKSFPLLRKLALNLRNHLKAIV